MSEAASFTHDPASDLPVTPDVADVESEELDLRRLYAEAVASTRAAVAQVEADDLAQLAEMGRRLGQEQDELYALVKRAAGIGVPEAASKGQRVATLLHFDGADKLREFCILYMLKGPQKPDLREEMRTMGVRPLVYRLRAEFQRAGFGVHHAWQRATNENTLSVTW